MSSEIKTNMQTHTATKFWGGDKRGMCVQITTSTPLTIKERMADHLQEEGFITLTVEEAIELRKTLGTFVREIKRIQEVEE